MAKQDICSSGSEPSWFPDHLVGEPLPHHSGDFHGIGNVQMRRYYVKGQ